MKEYNYTIILEREETAVTTPFALLFQAVTPRVIPTKKLLGILKTP